MVALPFIAIFTVATLLLGTALEDLEERLATDRALSEQLSPAARHHASHS